jgi:hypothetical protein
MVHALLEQLTVVLQVKKYVLSLCSQKITIEVIVPHFPHKYKDHPVHVILLCTIAKVQL